MSLQNALHLITRLKTDKDFRGELFVKNTPAELQEYLSTEGLIFTPSQMGDAYRKNLFDCRSQEDADDLKELIVMFQFISQQQLDI